MLHSVRMPAIVLESAVGSQYEDAPDSYEFPTRYRRFFEEVGGPEPIYAVIYEPRGSSGKGSSAYVGLAEIASSPVATGRRNRAGEELWRVTYRRQVELFEVPVPREVDETPVETWLGDRTRGRARNVATFGRAVRSLTEADFERILRLGSATSLKGASSYPVPGDHYEAWTASRERVARIVSVFERRAAFRREVLSAYRNQCAVTGLGLGPIPQAKSLGLLDAAHIRPVSSSGVDAVWNGVVLTPTLHRLFDQGLFTLRYDEGRLEVLTSPRLDRRMVEVPERRADLALRDGTPLMLPDRQEHWPKESQVDYHRRNVFMAR